MSMDQLMALVPIEAATTLSTTHKGRRSRWERATVVTQGKSRFGSKQEKPYLPPPFVDLPLGLTPLQVDQFLREQRLDELTGKLERGELEFGDPDIRPPSPPPAYDKNGNRTNTRDVRVRNAMVSEHQRLLEYMTSTVPGFLPPTDFKPVKKIRRIIIPQEKFPEYNFMGLIIGPRGCNHKRLESESGAQISIRGRGTQKEGKKTDHQTEEEASMPQHVHIAADTEEGLDRAVALIEPLLNPYHPAHEEFKKKGLEQLALVNGVSLTKLENRCSVCGAVGHLSWECPDTEFQSFQRAEVKCALCGDKGHVTMDCKLAKGMTSEQLAEIEKKQREAEGASVASRIEGGGDNVATTAGTMARQNQVQRVIPPPPGEATAPRVVDTARLDMEYSQMISELSGGGTPTPRRSGMNPLDSFSAKYDQPQPAFPTIPSAPQRYRAAAASGMIPPPPEQPQEAYYGATAAATGVMGGGAGAMGGGAGAMGGGVGVGLASYGPAFQPPRHAAYYPVVPQQFLYTATQAFNVTPMASVSPEMYAPRSEPSNNTPQQMEQLSQLMNAMQSGTLTPQQMEKLSQLMTELTPVLSAMAPEDNSEFAYMNKPANSFTPYTSTIPFISSHTTTSSIPSTEDPQIPLPEDPPVCEEPAAPPPPPDESVSIGLTT